MALLIHPSPATSTAFSCQLSSTLICAPLFSLPAPGLPPICEKPVLCGVSVELRVGVLADGIEEAAMPLYLSAK
jgi:hypothetical protein